MLRLFLFVFLSWSVAIAGPVASAEPEQVVLVYKLRALGVDEEIAVRVSDLLAKEIARLDAFRLTEPNKVKRAFDADPTLSLCAGDAECLLRAGKSIGADLVLTGVLARMAESFSLDVKLLDVAQGKVVRRLVQTWEGGDEQLIEIMRQVATRALRPEAFLGSLRVQVNQVDVKVFVDGDYVGRSPLPLQRLTPGQHAVKLSAEGFEDVERFVKVVFDRERLLQLEIVDASIREKVAAVRSDAGMAAGLRAGLMTDFSAVLGPSLMLHGAWRLPFWGRRLALDAQTGVFWSRREGQVDLDVMGARDVTGQFLAWSSLLGLALRPWPDAAVSPVLAMAAGPCVLWQQQEVEGFSSQSLRRLSYVLEVGLGAEVRLGPGTLGLQVGYRHAPLPVEENGGWQGRLGGMGVDFSYLLWW